MAAFGTLRLGLGWTRGGGGGDPTLLTSENIDAYLTAIGLAVTTSGTKMREMLPDGYEHIAANLVTTKVVEVEGVDYLGILPQAAGAGALTWSNNLRKSEWTKSNASITTVLGGLTHDADWRGPELFVPASATLVGATYLGDGVFTIDANVQGITMSGIIESDKWYEFIWTQAGAAGAIAYCGTTSSGDTSHAANRAIAGAGTYTEILQGNNQTFARFGTTAAGGTTISGISVREVETHSLVTATGDNATVTRALTSSETARTSRLIGDATGTVTLSQDNGSNTEAVPSSFGVLDLPTQTTANPTLRLALATSGDTCRVYDWQHFTGTAYRFLRPSGASAPTVGDHAIRATLAEAPATVDMTFLVENPPSSGTYVLMTLYESGDTNARLQLLCVDGDFIVRKNASTDETIAVGVPSGELSQIDVQWTDSVIQARRNAGAWATLTYETIHDFNRFDLGHDHTPANHYGAAIVAIIDNAETILLDGVNEGAG